MASGTWRLDDYWYSATRATIATTAAFVTPLRTPLLAVILHALPVQPAAGVPTGTETGLDSVALAVPLFLMGAAGALGATGTTVAVT